MRLRGAAISSLFGRTARILGVEMQAVDVLSLGAVLLFDLLIFLFGPGSPRPERSF